MLFCFLFIYIYIYTYNQHSLTQKITHLSPFPCFLPPAFTEHFLATSRRPSLMRRTKTAEPKAPEPK